MLKLNYSLNKLEFRNQPPVELHPICGTYPLRNIQANVAHHKKCIWEKRAKCQLGEVVSGLWIKMLLGGRWNCGQFTLYTGQDGALYFEKDNIVGQENLGFK